MGISERLYDLNKDEKGYGDIYRDDDGNLIETAIYYPYKDNKYLMVWESEDDYCKKMPAIYRKDTSGVHERVADSELAEKIYTSYKVVTYTIHQSDDGPSWYYGNHGTPSAQSPLQAFNMMCMNAGVGVEVKFCPNCGAKRADNAKFCTECGARLEE